ncbi:optic atrophy 3 protein-domain-containing protein [Dipodascopsis tothii]|uniref:optic atrophy 3 protein-domain-containing protein n=1 Tax=Dipodascopsis tothii TaxID=44089 RepID=UPI0034CF7991
MSSVALKITSLAIRTLAKPIANSLKARAKASGPFRNTCIGVAQTLNKIDHKLRLGIMGEPRPGSVRPLNDTKAIDMGANVLSETFLFAVAGGLIIYESVRSSQAKEAAEAERAAREAAEQAAAIAAAEAAAVAAAHQPGTLSSAANYVRGLFR